MDISDQIHAPTAFPLKKEPSILIGEEAGWTPEQVLTLE
jgi:hypothetical protein